MNNFFGVMIAILSLIMCLSLYRVFKGPTLFDRLTGLSLISTKTVVLILLLGAANHREDLYIDIGLTYAIIGFVAPLVLAKYCEINKETP